MAKQAKVTSKRIFCGDYYHCANSHQVLNDAGKVIGHAVEQWGESLKGKRNTRVWFVAKIGTRYLNLTNLGVKACGELNAYAAKPIASIRPEYFTVGYGSFIEARFSNTKAAEAAVKLLAS